ncbi:MAG: prepilin-type N-terminal cleavage/methylation domain-containing protein [Gammaproteobacteria bacterium]|nr:MAG: prepilin-type N-terminal cleavage/methylation domain-containing protein [Gammaproteobacteria bacterium]
MSRQEKGFTLVELMMTLAVIGVIAVFALPMFGDVVERNRVVAKSNEIVGAIAFARTEAVKTGKAAYVEATGGDWKNGLSVTDSKRTTTLRQVDLPKGYTLAATTTTVAVGFDSTGFASSTLTLRLCPADKSIPGKEYSIAKSGLVSVTSYTCP